MTYEHERRRWEAIKADQALIDQAARFLRHHGIQYQYSGLQHQEVAFGSPRSSTNSPGTYPTSTRVSAGKPFRRATAAPDRTLRRPV